MKEIKAGRMTEQSLGPRRKNYRRNLWIPPIEWSWVVKEAKRLNVSKGEVVRRIINEYFGAKAS